MGIKAEKEEKMGVEEAGTKRLQIEAAVAAGIDFTKVGAGGALGGGAKKSKKSVAAAAVRLAEGGEEGENLTWR
jgi:SAGA-associated factor 73